MAGRAPLMYSPSLRAAVALAALLLLSFAGVTSAADAFTFEQDHFNPENMETFAQRYWTDDTYSSDSTSPPILLYLSCFIAPALDFAPTAALGQWAASTGALLVELEVRYCGESLPADQFTAAGLSYQSIEQHLADVLEFREKFSYVLYPDYSASQWIVVGEYEEANTATWSREKNPNGFAGAVSVAAPLQAKMSFYEYQQVFAAYGDYYVPGCSAVIHNATAATEFVMDQSDATQQDQLKASFGCTDVPDNTQFYYVVAQIIEYGLSYFPEEVCQNMTAVSAEADASGNDDGVLVEGYGDVISKLLEASGLPDCAKWDLAFDTSTQAGNASADYRPSFYLLCTQFGQFETAGPNGPNVIVSTSLTPQWYLSICEELFGFAFIPDTAATNLEYGGREPWGSNYAFVSSVTNPFKDLFVNGTELEGSIFINLVTADSFFTFLSGLNVEGEVLEARQEVAAVIEQWLAVSSSPTPTATPSPSAFVSMTPDGSASEPGSFDDGDGIPWGWVFVAIFCASLAAMMLLAIVAFVTVYRTPR